MKPFSEGQRVWITTQKRKLPEARREYAGQQGYIVASIGGSHRGSHVVELKNKNESTELLTFHEEQLLIYREHPQSMTVSEGKVNISGYKQPVVLVFEADDPAATVKFFDGFNFFNSEAIELIGHYRPKLFEAIDIQFDLKVDMNKVVKPKP